MHRSTEPDPMFEKYAQMFIDEAKQKALDAILKQKTEEFREQIKPLIKEELEGLTMTQIQRVYDIQRMGDFVGIQFNWSDKPEEMRLRRNEEIER